LLERYVDEKYSEETEDQNDEYGQASYFSSG
jgi:hypothetical protein